MRWMGTEMKLDCATGAVVAGSFSMWTILAIACPFAVAESLMKRADHNPVISVKDAPSWRSVHVANAAVLTPQESPDGKWRMFIILIQAAEGGDDDVPSLTSSRCRRHEPN